MKRFLLLLPILMLASCSTGNAPMPKGSRHDLMSNESFKMICEGFFILINPELRQATLHSKDGKPQKRFNMFGVSATKFRFREIDVEYIDIDRKSGAITGSDGEPMDSCTVESL